MEDVAKIGLTTSQISKNIWQFFGKTHRIGPATSCLVSIMAGKANVRAL
ncbi:hypothetical protein P3W85_19225 [Cupriavidus basilensis]|uniref:Uncharacterized protein n=1 Tax=Cupriavidus basilensis TaxID=68895 RepID=A0ABT6ARK2_9BURK|nr:hypothetical protein [Cupriavidus basilensis]MDF3835074.1 hypothetical protein [Cupriavidus basilensis]